MYSGSNRRRCVCECERERMGHTKEGVCVCVLGQLFVTGQQFRCACALERHTHAHTHTHTHTQSLCPPTLSHTQSLCPPIPMRPTSGIFSSSMSTMAPSLYSLKASAFLAIC